MKTIVRPCVQVGALVVGHGANAAPTIPIHSPDVAPGQTFALAMLGLGEGFTWSVDLEGLSPFDTVLRLEVDVPAPDAILRAFHAYGSGGTPGTLGGSSYQATFGLFVNQTRGSWTEVEAHEYIYHNYLQVTLDEGIRTFDVLLLGLPDGDTVAPAGASASVLFGDLAHAIPLPAPAVLLFGAMAALAGLRRRKA